MSNELSDTPVFDGPGLEPKDHERLTAQLQAVRTIMADGRWRTLSELAAEVSARTGKTASEAGVSARLRDLRKAKFGLHTVYRRRLAGGLHEYRFVAFGAEESQ